MHADIWLSLLRQALVSSQLVFLSFLLPHNSGHADTETDGSGVYSGQPSPAAKVSVLQVSRCADSGSVTGATLLQH